MKKTILIIILFFCFITITNAETYYGEYRKVENPINYKEDNLKVESHILYNTYKTKYIDMGYMLENDEFIKDENDYIEEYTILNESEVSDEYITIKDSKNITTYSIQIINMKSNMRIYEIELYSGNKKLYYEIKSDDESKKLRDNDKTTYFDFKENYSYYINFFNTHKVEDLVVKIYTDTKENYKFILGINNSDYEVELHNENKNKHIISFDKNIQDRDITYKYMGNRKLYKYYKEEKEILNNYVEYGENLILDDYFILNDYYVRDKLIIKDEIIINHKEQDIYDFIEYSSGEVSYDCNIDYNANGIYKCIFSLNDIKVEKDIKLDIQEKEEENKKIINYKTNAKTTQKSDVVNLTNKSFKLKNTVKTKEDKKENNKSQKVNIIKHIIITNLIIIEIILFIKKKKK